MSDAYDDYDKTVEPKRFYFYRVVGHTITEYVTDRRDKVPWTGVKAEIGHIVREIGNNTLRPSRTLPRRRVWRKRNYFVVYYESANEHLAPGNAVTFSFAGGGGNHCFRDGHDIPKQNGVSIFYCLNHHKRATPGQPDETFKFELSHVRDSGSALARDREKDDRDPAADNVPKAPVAHIDAGTNTGPP